MFLTNFAPADLPTYQLALDIFNKMHPGSESIYINKAYAVCPGDYSLNATERGVAQKFWNIFEVVRYIRPTQVELTYNPATAPLCSFKVGDIVLLRNIENKVLFSTTITYITKDRTALGACGNMWYDIGPDGRYQFVEIIE